MHVVVRITAGPQWREGKSVYEQGPPVEGHLTAMRSHYAAGRLLLGGPFQRAAGIAVLKVDDLHAARAIMDADPAVAAGVMTYELDELTAIFDAFSGTEATGDVETVARTVA